MSIQSLGKGALRVAKNYTKGYSDVQAKVRDATSNDPWGPSGTQMNEVAQLTYNQNDFVEIMEMLDKRLNDKGKNWRHVFKALTLLDYCLHAGSENVVIYFRDNVYLVKTLKEFQYIDEYGKDQGANVRQKAKDITNLLTDEARLRQERRSRANMRDRMTKGTTTDRDEEDENAARRKPQQPPAPREQASTSRRNKDDDELKRAMEESRKTFEKEAGKSAEDTDLKRAMELSEKEERDRLKSLEDSNQRSLFDDGLQANTTQANPFPLVDAGLQPQYTLQPQFTSFNPYFQAQQEQQAMMQQQWAQQQADWQAQQLLLQQQQQQQEAQQQAYMQQQQQQQQWAEQQMAQQQADWAAQQQAAQQQAWLQAQQQQALVAQPTGFGSKNPFALGQGASASPPPPVPSIPSMPSLQIPNGGAQQHMSPSPAPSSATTSTGQPQVRTRPDENPALAALFANREGGIDTFGNYGDLRFGNTHAGKLLSTRTGGPAPGQTQNEQPFFSI